MRATAKAANTEASDPVDGWRRAALVDGVLRDQRDDSADPWINT